MSKNISLSDAVSIHYEGKACEKFSSGLKFATMRDLFKRLARGGYAWGDTYRFSLDHHRFSVTLPRPWLLGKIYPISTDIVVRDVAGVRVPNWKISELLAVYSSEVEAVNRARVEANNKRYGYKFRNGPAPQGSKYRYRKRHKPLLKNEMTASVFVLDDDDCLVFPKTRKARSAKALSLMAGEFRGRGRRSNGWKEHRREQWRS